MASKSNLSKGGEELRQELLERLIDNRLMGASTQVSFNQNPERLPMRELPHGSWSNVFLLYKSYCQTAAVPAASKSTFFQVCQRWGTCLKFHKRSQHQICETCSRLKMNIQNAKETWTRNLLFKHFSFCTLSQKLTEYFSQNL